MVASGWGASPDPGGGHVMRACDRCDHPRAPFTVLTSGERLCSHCDPCQAQRLQQALEALLLAELELAEAREAGRIH